NTGSEVITVDNNRDGLWLTASVTVSPGSGGSLWYLILPHSTKQQAFNIARLATSAYSRTHVTGASINYTFHANSPGNRYEHPGANGEGDNGIEIASGLDKFLIGHEAGHAFMHRRTAVNQFLLWDYSLQMET